MNPRSCLRPLVALGLASLTVTAAPAALAHGGIPRAYEILPEPGNPDHLVLRSYVWGLMHTRDAGQSWQYTCAEVYGGDSVVADHVNIAVLPGGRTVVAAGFNGLWYTDDGCDWTRSPHVADDVVARDVRLHDLPGGGLYLLTSQVRDGLTEGALWRSDDRGGTWAPFGAPLPAGFIPVQVAFPRGESTALYASGVWVDEGPVFLRAADATSPWTRTDLPLTFDDGDPRAVLVHPERPEVVFVWADRPEASGQDGPDKFLVTADGGATWRVIFQGTGDLPGFTLSPDGTKIYIGGSVDGIQEAPVDAALAQGPAAFQRVYEYAAWGLRFTDAGLMVGGDDYGASEPSYTLGVSTDLGRTASTQMTVCELEFTACGPDTDVGRRCEDVWAAAAGEGLRSDYIDEQCLPQGGPDAGPIAAASGKSEGGCSVNAGGAGSGALVGGLVALVALGRRRRRGSSL